MKTMKRCKLWHNIITQTRDQLTANYYYLTYIVMVLLYSICNIHDMNIIYIYTR